ncbi:MAG: glycosyltransferase [Chloroflexota bacterium]
MPGMVGEVRRQLRNFDIIHLHCLRSFQNIVIHHYAKKYDIPYIVDTHGSLPREHGKRDFKWLLKGLFDVVWGYRILRGADCVVAENEFGVSEYRRFKVNWNKIQTINPSFAVEEFSQLPSSGLFRQKHNLNDKKIIMFLGRINWIKGLDFLVESFAELVKARNNTNLVIVGNDDGFKAILDSLIAKLNLQDKVLFTGFLSGSGKLSALVDADVVVQTSRYEQGAWAPLEAVLCDTPIIVSRDTGAGMDVKRIGAGYLVEFGNKKEFSDTIQCIFDHPAEAKSKAFKAKEYIKAKLTMRKMIRKYEQLYAEFMRRHKR